MITFLKFCKSFKIKLYRIILFMLKNMSHNILALV